MRSRALQSAFLAVAAFLVICLVADAWAAPVNILEGPLKSWKGKVTVLAMRETPDGKSYEMIYYKDGVIRYRHMIPRGKHTEREPAFTYDLEKIKALSGDVSKAIEAIITAGVRKNVKVIIRGVSLREDKNGKLEYLVHVYHYTGPYTRSYIVDTQTWTASEGNAEKLADDPRKEPWAKADSPELPPLVSGAAEPGSVEAAPAAPPKKKAAAPGLTDAQKAAQAEKKAQAPARPARGKRKNQAQDSDE
jgi:hypothetical protein